MIALDRKLLRDTLHLRGPMIAVVLVVASGIASFVSMRSMYYYLLDSQTAYYDEYRFADLFARLKRAPDPLIDEIARIEGVVSARTRIVFDVVLDVPGLEEPATGRLLSIPENRVPVLNDIHLRRGRYIAPGRRDEVIASDAFVEANGLAVGDSLGAVLNGRWQRLRIVGIGLSPEYVYEIRGGADVLPDNRRFGVLWTSRDALAAAFDMEGAFNDVSLALGPGADVEEVTDGLDRILDRYGGLGAYPRADQASHFFLANEIEEARVSGTMIPSIFLGVAAFLLHIVLSRLVTTQRDQIGTLKAFGYRNGTVAAHYVKLALVPVLAGALLGTALGLWFAVLLADVYAAFFRFPSLTYEPQPGVIAFAILIAGGAALLGALHAVRAAASLPPAEAMRPPAPTRFEPGVLERFAAQQRLAPSSRIVVRSMERRPVKTTFSILGVAMAVAIMILGGFLFDSMKYMMDVQFRYAQREDVTVVFQNALPASVRYDLRHLPAVRRAEPVRIVPARLRSRHRSYRTAVFGVEEDSELRPIIDDRLAIHRLPVEGLLLTQKLGEILDVQAGDTVRVEVLEGRKPEKPVVVAGLVNELLGLSAYMRAGALSRLMGEGPLASAALMTVDEDGASHLYALLKETPAIMSVGVKEAALESFDETLATSFRISTTVLVLFAGLIAFGMIYNGARIALSERARELASLRVLGFSRKEVGRMLVGEQFALTAVAMPVGFAIGYLLSLIIVRAYQEDLFRLPMVVGPRTLLMAVAVVGVSAALSSLAVRRRLDRFDLVSVLKTRE